MRLVASLIVACSLLAVSGCKASPPAPAPPPPAATRSVRVDVWHDTVCPWCRIGLHNLSTATASLAPGVQVEVVHHPFLLNPDAPPGGKPLREHLAERYGQARLDDMFGRVSDFGAQYGVTFRWDKVSVMPNTVASHALLESLGGAQRPAVLDALHRAYFEEGQDLGDVAVLVAIARAAGVDEAAARTTVTSAERLQAVRVAADEAARQGITGVPFFLIAGQGFNGAQPPERLKAALEQAAR